MDKNMPAYRKRGDNVFLTRKSFKIICNSNRSIHAYPSDDYINKIKKHIGAIGKVTHTFLPSYNITVEFNHGSHDAEAFHMKDNWVEGFRD
jgi:predicted RNA methylase